MFTSVLSIGRAYRHITQRFRSRTPRRYCHLITLVTSVYRKTNVFLTTVGTATPPGGEMGEWSPYACRHWNYFHKTQKKNGSPNECDLPLIEYFQLTTVKCVFPKIDFYLQLFEVMIIKGKHQLGSF